MVEVNEALRKLIDEAKWVKTTYISPHEYIRKQDYPNLYSILALMIREQGYPAKFKGRTYRYIDIGEYQYWTFDVILNRAKKVTGDGVDGVNKLLTGAGQRELTEC